MFINLSQNKRFVLGVVILIIVDLIWVSSSELTKFIFNDTGFNKPFFSTYLKTSLFSLYLFGFLLNRRWRKQCFYHENHFCEVVPSQPDNNVQSSPEARRLSEASYVPLNLGTPEKLIDSNGENKRSVKFSRLTEVRHLSEVEATEAMFSRLSFSASEEAAKLCRENAKYPVKVVVRIASIFCLLWFAANYSYQKSLSVSEVGIVNVVSSTSSLFTLILAAFFPSSETDRFTLAKFTAVIFMMIGIGLICKEDINLQASNIPMGVIWSILGAFLYATYMVFIRRKVPNEEKLDFTMFFGFVGLLNAILLWPGFFIFSALGWESFEWPTREQLLYMLLNGLIGTVISELLWLWGCFLTSSLMATLSISLTIPLSMLCDQLMKGVSYSWTFYIGVIPVFGSFLAVSLLTHRSSDNDDNNSHSSFYKKCCDLCGLTNGYRAVSQMPIEEEEILINENVLDEDEETFSQTTNEI